MMPFFVAVMGAISVLPSVDPSIINVLLAVPLTANGHLVTTGWHVGTANTNEVMVDVVFMVVWAVILSLVSWKTFRWERRH